LIEAFQRKVDVAQMADMQDDLSDTDHSINGTEPAGWSRDDAIKTATTIGVVAIGAALIEVSLIPGLVIGVAATLAPKVVPRLGTSMQPMIKSVVRGAYKFGRKTRETMAEAHEQVHDIVAEVRAEDGAVAEAKPASHD
jgi:hypothetical protein